MTSHVPGDGYEHLRRVFDKGNGEMQLRSGRNPAVVNDAYALGWVGDILRRVAAGEPLHERDRAVVAVLVERLDGQRAPMPGSDGPPEAAEVIASAQRRLSTDVAELEEPSRPVPLKCTKCLAELTINRGALPSAEWDEGRWEVWVGCPLCYQQGRGWYRLERVGRPVLRTLGWLHVLEQPAAPEGADDRELLRAALGDLIHQLDVVDQGGWLLPGHWDARLPEALDNLAQEAGPDVAVVARAREVAAAVLRELRAFGVVIQDDVAVDERNWILRANSDAAARPAPRLPPHPST